LTGFCFSVLVTHYSNAESRKEVSKAFMTTKAKMVYKEK
jgi:hypothetical protein